MITYTIEEGQLVRLYHDRPECAWVLPDSESVTVLSLDFDLITGRDYSDIVELSDGRCVIADINCEAAIYKSVEAAFRGDENQQLKEVGE
jgi:hypothetical protein